MKWLLGAVLALACSACVLTPAQRATVAANAASELLVGAAPVLEERCVDAFRRLGPLDGARFVELEPGCRGAAAAYRMARVAVLGLRAVVLAYQLGEADGGDLARAHEALVRALRPLVAELAGAK